MIYAIVLAAGKGTRMKTDLPKCSYPFLNKPMISYILSSLKKSVIEKNIVVLGYKKEYLEPVILDSLTCVQTEQLGTAHACMMALPLLEDGISLIVPGDTPLIDEELINEIISVHQNEKNTITVGTMLLDNPFGYGRIIRENNEMVQIVEEKEASVLQKAIKEVNSGIIVVDNKALKYSLSLVKNDNQKGEYYLTDIIKIIKETDKVGTFLINESYKVMGINDLYTKSVVEELYLDNLKKKYMLSGVNMINPKSIVIGPDVSIASNVTIYPNSIIMGNSVIKDGAEVGPNTELVDAVVGENVKVSHSTIYNSEIKENSTVGPFVHLRNQTVIGPSNRIGNFVEMKNTTTQDKTHVVHLSYVGDSTVGENVNFGCGVVTCNYDGKEKHRTEIGDNVFIGCNSNLIAPIHIMSNSFIAAGSTITDDIPEDCFAIARVRQTNKENYVKSHDLLKKKR